MSTIRIQAIPKFPASVEAGDGVLIARSGGVFTFSVDPAFMPSFSPASPFTVGDLLFASDANAIDALADVATGNVLLSGGVGAAPSYGKVGLATHVSGILPTANGGTGLSSSVVFGAGGTVAYLGSAQTFTAKQTFQDPITNIQLSGNTAPQIMFIPVSGATKTLQIYQQGDALHVAAFGVADRLFLDLNTGALRLNAYTAGALFSDGSGNVTASNTPTLGASGTLGSLTFGNATSGTVKIQPVAGALGTVTLSLPAASDTLVGKATTDTLTNKTFNTAGTGNVFQINGTTVSDKTGSGKIVLDTSPTLVTPVLGAASGSTLTLSSNGINAFKVGSAAPVFNNAQMTLTATGNAYVELTDGTRSMLFGSDVGGTFVGSFSNHDLVFRANNVEVFRALTGGNVKFSNAANFSANGSVATVLGSLGPAGSRTTVQKWLTIVDSTGATLYIPAF